MSQEFNINPECVHVEIILNPVLTYFQYIQTYTGYIVTMQIWSTFDTPPTTVRKEHIVVRKI